MLIVDDHFKSWMRYKLRNRNYAERVLRTVTELDDAVLEDTWPHAALPEASVIEADPETMIGSLKGYDPSTGKKILVAIFGKWEDFKDMSMLYAGYLWGMYDVGDESNLPVLYEVAFMDMDVEDAINHIRWRDTETNEEAECFGFDMQKINIINTRLDSDVIRLITGKNIDMERQVD